MAWERALWMLITQYAVTMQDERISAERQGMIKYHNNGNGWFNILLKYLSGITRANG